MPLAPPRRQSKGESAYVVCAWDGMGEEAAKRAIRKDAVLTNGKAWRSRLQQKRSELVCCRRRCFRTTHAHESALSSFLSRTRPRILPKTSSSLESPPSSPSSSPGAFFRHRCPSFFDHTAWCQPTTGLPNPSRSQFHRADSGKPSSQ